MPNDLPSNPSTALPPQISIPGLSTPIDEGRNPIVVIGPNGSGKTQFGVSLSRANGGAAAVERIPALRNIELSTNVSPVTKAEIDANLLSFGNAQLNEYWRIAQDVDWVFRSLIVEHASEADRFREQEKVQRGTGIINDTTMDLLRNTWTELFPGRSLDFSNYSPRVSSQFSGNATYEAARMSDGERAALYLAGRVLNSRRKVIIIDEPELHFHNRLAVLFWDTLESLCPDRRFIYVTHDLPFALSRNHPYFIVVRPNSTPEVFTVETELPEDVARDLLSAASFSIYADRIVFCEGNSNGSKDSQLYDAWFRGRDTVVYPVGSCAEVQNCVSAYAKRPIVRGLTVTGIVDRDYLPDEQLTALENAGVHPLKVHEVESLLCIDDVVRATATHLGMDPELTVTTFSETARRRFQGQYLNYQVSQRFRRRCERTFDLALNRITVDSDDLSIVKANHVSALQPTAWGAQPEHLFDEEKNRLEAALNGDSQVFLELFPGKAILGDAARALGFASAEAYVDLVCRALVSTEPDDPLAGLGTNIETALAPHLPPRCV